MYRIRQVTPFLHVPDLERALDMLTRVLRFEIKYREPGYAYLEWGDAALRLLEERDRATLPPDGARMTVYLDVEDVDDLYRELLPQLATLPAGDFHAPHDQPWRQREVHVRLPDGHWLAFGQAVAPGTADHDHHHHDHDHPHDDHHHH
jgi:catechol 2,3-dioxygenase-like lactoylglutathione lyase family enzyme